MRRLIIALLGLAFVLPMVGCDKNEVKIERRGTIQTIEQDTIVVPD